MVEAEKEGTSSIVERRCEGFYYAGMIRLQRGDTREAREFFKKCVATGVHEFMEYEFAEAELAALSRSAKP